MPTAYIVGSGASGGMLARLLARSGQYQVVIIEKGPNYFTNLGSTSKPVSNVFVNDELGYEARQAPINQDPLLEPRSFRTDTNSARDFVGDVNTLPTTVGGGTTHYDAKARRLREVDFVTNSLMGGKPGTSAIPEANYADWPMQYKHLEAFYAVAEEVVGVQGPAHMTSDGTTVVNPNPYESARSTPFAMPPGVAQLNSLLPAEAAARLGYKPAAVPTSINSRPYGGRPACNDCAHCLDFGCPSNAKGGGVWQVHDAMRAGAQLWDQVNVIGFHMVPSANGRRRVDGFSYVNTVDGTTATQPLLPDDILVLANTPIEAVRLSLVSNGNSRWEASLDRSGQLGQNLMFHLQSDIICITDRNIHSWRGRTSTHTLDAFAGAGPRPSLFDPAVLRGGILEIGGNQNPITEASDVASFLTGSALKAYMQLGPFSKRLTTFTMQGEDMPQQSNAVDLDLGIVDVYGQPVPRVTYKSHPYELAAAAAYAPRMLEIMEAIGGPGSKYPSVRPLFAANLSSTLPAVLPSPIDSQLSPVTSATPLTNIPSSRHILGTHRMALDPELGPCDPFGRYWNVDNLYHVGGGLYVTAPGYNVTLTMWALSYWVGAALLKGVGNRTTAYTSTDIDDVWPALASVIHEQDGNTMIGQLLTGNFQAYKQRFPEEDRERWF